LPLFVHPGLVVFYVDRHSAERFSSVAILALLVALCGSPVLGFSTIWFVSLRFNRVLHHSSESLFGNILKSRRLKFLAMEVMRQNNRISDVLPSQVSWPLLNFPHRTA